MEQILKCEENIEIKKVKNQQYSQETIDILIKVLKDSEKYDFIDLHENITKYLMEYNNDILEKELCIQKFNIFINSFYNNFNTFKMKNIYYKSFIDYLDLRILIF
ncbi:MAG: hypothetical protein KGD63_06870 [Candidatus Lokiarchaeota archaeon]|nr:hypothetical protein [Candidatus Lokiarchaeota archaeon]